MRTTSLPPSRRARSSARCNSCKRALTADAALRLALYIGTSPELWLNLQTDYELRTIRRERGRDIEAQVRARAA